MIDPVELAGHLAQSASLLGNHLAGPVKAMLYCVDKPDLSLTLQFNPDDLRIDRGLQVSRGHGKIYSGFESGGGENDKLSFDVWVDESEPSGAEALVTSLLPYTFNVIGKATSIEPKLKAFYELTRPGSSSTDLDAEAMPPVVVFLWEKLKFTGVITQMGFTLNMFNVLGAPQRARVTMTIEGRAFYSTNDPEDIILDSGEPQSFSTGLGSTLAYAAKTTTRTLALRVLNRLR